MSECQKELCKILRGDGNMDHLAEEVADATIMLEQVRLIFNLDDLVCQKMDEKVQRLDDRLRAQLPKITPQAATALERMGDRVHSGMAILENRCVCCGEIIPEGWIICPRCLRK